LPLIALLLSSVGCGSGLSPVTGVVTLDGAPVDNASVTLVSEDGKTMYVGATDSTGNFTIATGEEVGAKPGTYKVLVVKTKHIEGAESMNPSDPAFFKAMEKSMKESKAAAPKSGPPGKGFMPPGVAAPPGMGGGVVGPKSELPPNYASLNTTTLTVKVPVDNPPVKLELVHGPKK